MLAWPGRFLRLQLDNGRVEAGVHLVRRLRLLDNLDVLDQVYAEVNLTSESVVGWNLLDSVSAALSAERAYARQAHDLVGAVDLDESTFITALRLGDDGHL